MIKFQSSGKVRIVKVYCYFISAAEVSNFLFRSSLIQNGLWYLYVDLPVYMQNENFSTSPNRSNDRVNDYQ